MRKFIVPTGFAAIVLAITWTTPQAECKESAALKEAQNAAIRSAEQHAVNATHTTGEVRATEEHLINKGFHKGVTPATGHGFVETPGMARKEAEVTGTHGFKNESKQLLKEEENKGINKLIDEGTPGMHKKGW